MKAKEPQSERKSKKPKRKEDIATTSGYHADTKLTHAATDVLPQKLTLIITEVVVHIETYGVHLNVQRIDNN